MQMLIKSVLYVQSLRKLQWKLWYKLISSCMHYLRSGYSPGGRAGKNYLPGRRVNNLLLARQRK